MTMIYAAAAASAFAAALWYKQSKPTKQTIHGTVHYNAVSDEYELRIAGNGPTRITDVTHTGLECMSKAGYNVRTYTPTNIDRYALPVILALTTNNAEAFTEACARCRVRSRIQYTVANHKQATTTTVHWDQIVCPDEFVHQDYTDLMPLTH